MWEPRRLTTLWAFTACYRDSFTFFYKDGDDGTEGEGAKKGNRSEPMRINGQGEQRFTATDRECNIEK
jgi:hypothetical protein